MEEVLELFSMSEETSDSDDDTPPPDPPVQQLWLAISQEALTGKAGFKTMQFVGYIEDIPIKVLVDSSSTTSFLSEQLISQLSSLKIKPADHKAQIADGRVLQCSSLAEDCSWSMGNTTFTQSLKILSIPACDIILGMNWLEQFSPMKVDWKMKWM